MGQYPFLSKMGTLRFGIAALVFPLVIRAIPEVIATPYPIGYDTIAAYVPSMLDVKSGTLDSLNPLIGGWLLYAILATAYLSTSADPVLIAKAAGPVLYGVVGLSEYFFARKYLAWDQNKSLAFVLISSVYFVSLRISLDLLRNTLGISFLLLSLSLSKSVKNHANALLFSASVWLTTATHLLMGTLLLALVSFDLLGSNVHRTRRIACSIPGWTYYFLSLVNIQFLGVSIFVESALEFQSFSVLVYPLYIFLPLLPAAFFGRSEHRGTMRFWLLLCVLGIVLGTTPISISAQLVSPDRWSLMMAIPLSALATTGLMRLRKASVPLTRIRRGAYLGWMTILIILGVTYVALPVGLAFPYYTFFTPTSMLQSTVPLEDSESVVHVVEWLSANIQADSVLMTDHAMYGWARRYFHAGNAIVGFPPDTSLASAFLQTTEKGYTRVWTVWWLPGFGWYGETSVPTQFILQHSEGRIGAYLYDGET